MKKTLCTIAAAFLLLGSVKQATAQTGQALNFSSGGNNYAITSTNIAHGNHFTYEAWVNIITPSDWAGIMTTNTQTGQAQWVQFSINSAGNLRCEIVDDANNNKTYDGTTVLTGSWHHVAITFDGTSLLFYVDGNVETTTIFQDATLGTMTVNSLLNVGAERSLGSQINGTIDAARVWNVTRTQAQIQSTMHVELTSAQAGLIANYNFDEGIANSPNPGVTILTDASGSGLNATLNNFTLSGNVSNWVAPGATGLQGAALNFDGSNDLASANISPAVTVNSAFTIEAWVKPNTTTGVLEVFSTRTSTVDYGFDFSLENGNTIHGDIGKGTGWITTAADAPFNYTAGVWMHIAYVITNSSYTIFVNGNQVASNTFVGTPLLLDASRHYINIGSGNEIASGNMFNGNIDEVRVWNRALCQGEIQNNMNAELALPQTNLLAYYQFNEGVSGADNTGITTLSDISGNGYNGTLTSFALNGATSNWSAPGGVTSGVNAPAFVSPVISVTAGGTINFGSTATLTASGVSTYTWSANAASATTASVSVSPTVTTTYSVVGTNSVGCLSNMATSTVSINGAALNFDGSNDSVSIGHTMNTALFNKTSVTVESWIYPTSFAGSYKTIIGNYSTPLNQMQFDMRLQGNSVTFFVSAGSGYRQVLSAPNTITLNTWQHVAGVWDGNNLMIYVNGVLSATQTGITGSLVATTNDIVIGGNTIPENFVGSIDEVRIWTRALCQGEIQNSMNGELILPQTGLLAYYQFNEGVSAGSNSTVTALTDVTGNGYNGTLTNMALTGATSNWVAPGGVTTGSVAPAFVSPSIAVSGTTTICAGATTTLTAAGNVSTYTWTAGPATAAYTVNPTSNATYSVVGTNSVGCNSNMALATVTVNALPTVGVNSQAICTGNAAALTATGAATYTWSTTETTATIAPTPTAATTDYTVTGTDANNCMNSAVATVTVNALPTLTVTASASVICAGATSTLTATGADTYTWSTSDYTAATIVTPTATTTDYTVTGTDVNNCMNSAVSTVTVNALPTLTVTVNTATVCAGTMDMISVNGTPTSYTWSTGVNTTSITPTPTVTSSYTVTGTDGNNCMNMAVATINVNALPTLTITPSDTIICPGAMVTLTANGATTYTWSTSQTTGSIVATPTANATYSVSGTDGNGCTGMSSTNVTVTICAGIAKYSNNINVSIYPNPSKGEFTIASANYAENTTLTIYNAIGQAVYTTKLNSALQTINANLANGMYVIRLQNAQGTGMQHIVITE